MTKLIRKLKQMAKKRAHRKTVQKRREDRAQKEIESMKLAKTQQLEHETDLEIARLNGEASEAGDADKKLVRVVGGLVLEAPQRKSKKKMTRKQMKRQEKIRERGVAVAAQIDRKITVKKGRIKLRAQIRNENLDN